MVPRKEISESITLSTNLTEKADSQLLAYRHTPCPPILHRLLSSKLFHSKLPPVFSLAQICLTSPTDPLHPPNRHKRRPTLHSRRLEQSNPLRAWRYRPRDSATSNRPRGCWVVLYYFCRRVCGATAALGDSVAQGSICLRTVGFDHKNLTILSLSQHIDRAKTLLA